jgi:hypothetical protein
MYRNAFVAATALGLAAPVAAEAQPPACVSRTDLIKHLANKYHEAPAAVGLADSGALLEVFVSKEGETWTVAITMPNGVTCMVATGQHWQDLPRIAKVEEPT